MQTHFAAPKPIFSRKEKFRTNRSLFLPMTREYIRKVMIWGKPDCHLRRPHEVYTCSIPEIQPAFSCLSNDFFKLKQFTGYILWRFGWQEIGFNWDVSDSKHTLSHAVQHKAHFAAIDTATMTGQPQQQEHDISRDSSLYKYLKAMNNKHGVRFDMEALCKFVRETLFYALIHDARGSSTNPNDEVMGENGKACKIFVLVFLRDKDKISNSEMLESTPEEKSSTWNSCGKRDYRQRGDTTSGKHWVTKSSLFTQELQKVLRVSGDWYHGLLSYLMHNFLTNDSKRTSSWLHSQ